MQYDAGVDRSDAEDPENRTVAIDADPKPPETPVRFERPDYLRYRAALRAGPEELDQVLDRQARRGIPRPASVVVARLY